ncbi:hypothetical protein Poli38472_011846 [Pythium oligandrum]|uniref:Uncharacterized protein n=1 Tax=Pythium oligandrum TaxID=41045 RepID=A0A8K1FGZ6_PYTOL|nr:hypothetical protein Poli38472_011846 [Pythium oligandrum]|eukprot:TMW58258.1 hypothetical protein Poli38472_011846 [Pythium oligandrum]
MLAKPVNAVDKMWPWSADGQFQLLEDSERENARLRGLVQEQLRLIHGLERVLMKKRSKTMSLYSSRSRCFLVYVDQFTQSPLHNFHRIEVNVTADRALRVIEGKYNFRGYGVPFRTKLIVRRVVRDDRIIFPVAMFIDPMYMNGDKHSGVFLRERSWNVFRAAPSDDSVPSDVPLCYRQTYSLVKPELFSSDYGDSLAQLTKWQIQTTSLRVIMNNEALEDKLLASFGKLEIAE